MLRGRRRTGRPGRWRTGDDVLHPPEHLVAVAPGPGAEQHRRLAQAVRDGRPRLHAERDEQVADQRAEGDLGEDQFAGRRWSSDSAPRPRGRGTGWRRVGSRPSAAGGRAGTPPRGRGPCRGSGCRSPGRRTPRRRRAGPASSRRGPRWAVRAGSAGGPRRRSISCRSSAAVVGDEREAERSRPGRTRRLCHHLAGDQLRRVVGHVPRADRVRRVVPAACRRTA